MLQKLLKKFLRIGLPKGKPNKHQYDNIRWSSNLSEIEVIDELGKLTESQFNEIKELKDIIIEQQILIERLKVLGGIEIIEEGDF